MPQPIVYSLTAPIGEEEGEATGTKLAVPLAPSVENMTVIVVLKLEPF